jgi:hypothetical protein
MVTAAHASVDDGGEVADRGGLVRGERLKRGGVALRPVVQLVGGAARRGAVRACRARTALRAFSRQRSGSDAATVALPGMLKECQRPCRSAGANCRPVNGGLVGVSGSRP